MPTNRRQHIPGKTPRPSRNSHRSRTPRSRTARSTSRPSVVKGGFSTSGPSMGFSPQSKKSKPSATGYQPNPLNVGGPAPSKITPEVLLTRRNLLIGAAAVGGIAAIGGGVSLASSALDNDSSNQVSYIDCLLYTSDAADD